MELFKSSQMVLLGSGTPTAFVEDGSGRTAWKARAHVGYTLGRRTEERRIGSDGQAVRSGPWKSMSVWCSGEYIL